MAVTAMSSVAGQCYSLRKAFTDISKECSCLRPQSQRLPKTLKMDNIHFSEMSINFYQIT